MSLQKKWKQSRFLKRPKPQPTPQNQRVRRKRDNKRVGSQKGLHKRPAIQIRRQSNRKRHPHPQKAYTTGQQFKRGASPIGKDALTPKTSECQTDAPVPPLPAFNPDQFLALIAFVINSLDINKSKNDRIQLVVCAAEKCCDIKISPNKLHKILSTASV